MPMIQPRVLKGFRDFLPDMELKRSSLIKKLENIFTLFGFVPIDTPALEYAEILLGKGGGETDKQIYRFRDHGDRDIALRFDLTVPFARFMAEHVEELYLPFRRYHIAKVWRGENTQRGRYREFMQCDFDIVGTDSPSADADILLTAAHAMRALEVGDFSLRINHRTFFNRFLARIGTQEKSEEILRIVDKREKIGTEATEEMLSACVGPIVAKDIIAFVEKESTFDETLQKMTSLCAADDEFTQSARSRLLEIMDCMSAEKMENHVVLDPSITRGLDYYTGMVVETSLAGAPHIGSVCSGGRYNELASLYTDKKLPGVGASVGLDRLIAALESIDTLTNTFISTQILILQGKASRLHELHALAASLRILGFSCEVFPEPKKVASQYNFAEKKHIPLAVSLDSPLGGMNVRILSRRETIQVPNLESLSRLASVEIHKND